MGPGVCIHGVPAVVPGPADAAAPVVAALFPSLHREQRLAVCLAVVGFAVLCSWNSAGPAVRRDGPGGGGLAQAHH